MKKKSKLLKIALFVVIASISVNVFCFPAYAQERKTVENNAVLKYNGTVDELPEHIIQSYHNNPKAESLDVYDENLYSITTNNTDGTKTLEIFQAPIKYIEDNEIKFIDTTIEEVSALNRLVSNKYYECTNTPVKSHFPEKLEDGVSVENDSFSIKCYPKT